jgi:outer membrane biosynthesis protein TonB
VNAAAPARRNFDAQDLTIAFAVALLAQLLFVLSFSLPSPKLVMADISDENAQPIAVAITPVLKLGSKNPTAVNPWQRKKPVASKSQGALPSPQAEKTPESIPSTNVPDAAVAPVVVVDAGAVVQPNTTDTLDAAVAQTASSTPGSEQGASTGTETDPLKARAADMYRAQLASWFVSRFNIKGKIPFDKLKTLHATAVVTVTPDRRVGSFSVVTPSGDPTFDAEVKATLSSIQSGGAELPAPPPNYPDMLGKSLPVGFQCTVQKYCE